MIVIAIVVVKGKRLAQIAMGNPWLCRQESNPNAILGLVP